MTEVMQALQANSTAAIAIAAVAVFGLVLLFRNAFLGWVGVGSIGEERRHKEQQLRNLYSPLYHSFSKGSLLLKSLTQEERRIYLAERGFKRTKTEADERKMLTDIISPKAQYSEPALTELWMKYKSSPTGSELENQLTANLARHIIIKYNELRRDLGLPFNKVELKTGKKQYWQLF